MRRVFVIATLFMTITSLGLGAQGTAQPAAMATQESANVTVPVYKVTVVGRTVKAINYRNRQSTQIGFEGTSLLAKAEGSATVESKQGAIQVHASFRHLVPAATQFGSPYLTYVLWAVTLDGRPMNLGEILPNDDGNARLDAATALQAFGLVVTAEPYFAVTRPSDIVVAENRVLPNTTGTIEQVDGKYELLKRGEYTRNLISSAITPIEVKGQAPLDIYEAENAIRIAKWAGASEYASDTLSKAELNLQNAQQAYQSKHSDKKDVITMAREAVQTAEDARIIALNKLEARHQLEMKQSAEEAQAQAAQAQVQAAQAQSQAAAAQAQAQAESQAKIEAQAAQQQAQQQAEQANANAAQAQNQAEKAQQHAKQAEQQAAQMRAKLLQQLNAILQTQDTPRGLMVRMSDVLFATGRYELAKDAKLALAKISGVLLAYPGLKLEVDGYTDSTGSDQTNQALSEKRAEAVRIFLLAQGVSPDSIIAQGFGNANPIASNDTSQGRQMNRRVDLLLSGTVIGTEVTSGAMASASRQ